MQHSVSMLGATLATLSLLGISWAQTPAASRSVSGDGTPPKLESVGDPSGVSRNPSREAVGEDAGKALDPSRKFAQALRRSELGSLSATEWCLEAFDGARLDRGKPLTRKARPYSLTESAIKLRLYERWIDLWSGRLTDRSFDILAHLENEARLDIPSLGRQTVIRLLDRLATTAGVDRSAAQVLLVQARQLALTGDPERVARARKIHDRIQKHFSDTPEAHKAKRAAWRIDNLSIGKVAPNFTTYDPSGNEIRLSDFRGHVVVVHFWRRDAGREAEDRSLDELRALMKRHWDTPFALIAINGDSNRDNHRVRWVEHGVVWHEASEAGPSTGARAAWKIDDWPSTYVLDVEGMVHGMTFPGISVGKLVDPLVTRHVASLEELLDSDTQGAH